ncbi:MAG: hypothetical protein F6J87_23675 [Spirulina sp. SIO3F2]|nr:hypothetical protein [Spirulina sp. SIO3F2]
MSGLSFLKSLLSLHSEQLVVTTALEQDQPHGQIPLKPGGYGLRSYQRLTEKRFDDEGKFKSSNVILAEEDEDSMVEVEIHRLQIWKSSTFESSVLHGNEFIQQLQRIEEEQLKRRQERYKDRIKKRNFSILICLILLVAFVWVWKFQNG